MQMQSVALSGIALVSGVSALILALRASGGLAAVADSLPAALLAAASICAIVITTRPAFLRSRLLQVTMLSAGFVAFQGLGYVGSYVLFLFNGHTPSLPMLLLGASYFLGAAFVIASLRIRVHLVTRRYR